MAILAQKVALKDSTELQYLITDHLGSVVAVTNASGTLTSQQRYLPFGQVRTDLNGPRITQTDFGYTGQRDMTGLGLMDYRTRMYDPALGRFIQPDSIIPNAGNPQSWNRYGYVLNNPIMFNDPTGHDPYSTCNGNTQCMSMVTQYPDTIDTNVANKLKNGGGGDNLDDDLDTGDGGNPDANGCYDTNGNGVVDIPCPTHPLVWIGRSNLCTHELGYTLIECYYAGGLLDMGEDPITIDPKQFGDLLIAVHYDINNRTYAGVNFWKVNLDTPYFDYYGKYSGSGCLYSLCGKRSEINYVEQGMISARLGQSVDQGIKTVDTWKKWTHGLYEGITTGDFTRFTDGPYASDATYKWFKLGYYVEKLLSGAP